MAGTVYGHSVSASMCTIFSTRPTYAWPLGGRYRTLTAVVGQDDGSTSRTDVATLTVRGDGRVLWSGRAVYGRVSSLSVDVRGVRQLTVKFTETRCGDGGSAAALGSARVGQPNASR